ncbi:hypothetical protein BJX66DRAFT_46625 [Aspergillus keveii]|uniref:Secreted protein n=1 Tax=Aspergillus keveii TaxID=714993 RepID=A0ABR4GIL6_9EURO
MNRYYLFAHTFCLTASESSLPWFSNIASRTTCCSTIRSQSGQSSPQAPGIGHGIRLHPSDPGKGVCHSRRECH